MAGHYLTGDLVLKESWSEQDQAIKVIPASNTEFTVELNHADGDSVHTVRKTSVITAEVTIDATEYSECAMYGYGEVQVSADGENFFPLTNIPITPVKFCAMQIKLISTDPNARLVLKA